MKPTFIGIGPPRCGTTSVYHYLKQHPQVFMSPVKETHFFAYQILEKDILAGRAILHDPVTSVQQYEALFRGAGTARAIGEISPGYLWRAGVAEAIHGALPDARLFCILRNPIDRAYSAYRAHVADGQESRSFEQVVREETDSPSKYPLGGTNYHIRIGMYAFHLEPYRKLFREAQLKICFYEDLESSAEHFMRELFAFIGVDPELVVDTSSRFNTMGGRQLERRLQSSGLGWVSRRLRKLIPRRLYYFLYRGYSAAVTGIPGAATIRRETREQMRDAYAADIAALQSLTGRDLSNWLKV